FAAISDGAGGWYLGGAFDSVGNQPRANVARVMSNLSVSSWAPQVDDAVYSLALSGSTVYLGGVFQNVSSTYRPWLVEVSVSSGNLTSWDSQCDGPVYAMGINGTQLYVGGLFCSFGSDFR